MEQPSVLVLGATGFIGRNLVRYLLEDNKAKVTAVDKVLPNCAYLSKEEEELFEHANFQQKNLVNPASIATIWDDGAHYDYVINLAAETKYGHNDEVYKERVWHLSLSCAREAAKHNVKRFIEVSTAQVYESSSSHKDESGKIDPWTNIAKFKYQVEEDLKGIDGLDYVVVRPAIVYGIGDKSGIAPRIICGAIYQYLGKKMKLLWNGDLKINTVHVSDVCKALWHLCTHGEKGAVYNLADKNDTDQGKINAILEHMFGIETKFAGKMISGLAKTLGMDTVVAEVNERHVAPWSKMNKEKGIEITPLSPYLDKELLGNNNLSVDGSAIEATGFTYDVPEVTEEKLREWVDYYLKMGLFPEGYLK
ncbi:NAD-binding domain 4 domain containing protein [Balamuthia mandrillaris]